MLFNLTPLIILNSMLQKLSFSFTAAGLLFMIVSLSPGKITPDGAVSPGEFHFATKEDINRLLPLLYKKFPKFSDRIHALSLLRIGTPYEFKILGEGDGFDPNPIFRIDKTNCTVFVLTNMALASATSYQQAESLMNYLNYYPVPDGENPISYQNRRHFTADRLLTSEYFELITTHFVNPAELETVTIVLNRQSDGSHFLPIDWQKKIEISYIPKKHITAKLLNRLPSVCGVGIIRQEMFDKGIVIAHEGIIFNQKDFIHASKDDGKVVKENFHRYFRKYKKDGTGPICDGIVLYLMKEVIPKLEQHNGSN